MKKKNIASLLILSLVSLVLALNMLFTGGCENPNTPPPDPLNDVDMSGIYVPDIDLDMCAFVIQDTVTVPVELFGWSDAVTQDIQTSRLVVWGTSATDEMVVGGSIYFSNADNANKIYNAVNGKSKTWVKVDGNTLYFVHGSGSVAQTMQNAVSENRFKQYDNDDAKTEISLLPDNGSVKLLAAGAVVPSDGLINLITRNIDSRYRSTVNTVIDQAKIEVMAVGLYSDKEVDGAQVAEKAQDATLWDTKFGCVVLFKSSYSGVLFAPVIKGILGNAGYSKITEGNMTYYKDTLVVNNGASIPIYIRVDGNRVYAVVAGTDEYVKTILDATVQP